MVFPISILTDLLVLYTLQRHERPESARPQMQLSVIVIKHISGLSL